MAKKQPPKTAARKTPKRVVVPVGDTIIDVIEEPVPGAVVVSEYVRTATPILSDQQPISSDQEPKRDPGPETEEQ
jgi:hypothetical protein